MNLRKPVSLLLIVILATLTVYAGPCINCKVKIKTPTKKRDVLAFNVKKSYYFSKDKTNPDYIMPLEEDILPLDDNEPSTTKNVEENNSIVLIDETQNLDNNHSILEQKIIYACEDSEHNTLVCDREIQMCECV